jgi:hypothetical protein
MEEMTYTGRFETPKVLHCGKKDGIAVLVLSMGHWPCAYLGIDKEHPLAKSLLSSGEPAYENFSLPVHGGLTYAEVGEGDARSEDLFWLGWDYAHAGDYIELDICKSLPPKEREKHEEFWSSQRKWSTEEIVKEAEDAIPLLRKEMKKHEMQMLR